MLAVINLRIALVAFLVNVAASAPLETTIPVISLSKRTATHVSLENIVAADSARIGHFNGQYAAVPSNSTRSNSTAITNLISTYAAEVSFCNSTYPLVIDTGSSVTWVGGILATDSCGVNSNHTLYVQYGTGTIWGEERIGPVSVGGVTAKSQYFGSVHYQQGSFPNATYGILGLGPTVLTMNTVANVRSYPTFMDNIFRQGSIKEEVIGIYFRPEPINSTNPATGALTLGGTDPSKYSGLINYAPRSLTYPWSNYWSIDDVRLLTGSESFGPRSSAVVDTGTAFLYIPTSSYNTFLALSGGANYTTPTAAVAHWTHKPTVNLVLEIGTHVYTLTPDEYLLPKDQYADFKVNTTGYVGWIGAGGLDSGFNFIIGQKFLEIYYSVFDTTNSRIGFAKAV